MSEDPSNAPVVVFAGVAVDVAALPGATVRAGTRLPVHRRLSVDVSFDGGARGLAAPVPWASVTIGGDVPLFYGLSAFVEGGGAWNGAVVPIGRLGLAYTPARLPLRFGVAGQSADGFSTIVRLDFQASLARRPPEPLAPTVAHLPPPAPPDDPLVWVPHPVCEWLPATQAEELVARLGPMEPETSRGVLPVDPEIGGLVVVAAAGDVVRVSGVGVPVGEDGTAVIASAEGPVIVEVEGGGRFTRLEGETSGGYTVWLRAAETTPVVLPFEGALPPDLADRLGQLVTLRGAHRYEVVGTWVADESPLAARSRAEAVLAWLTDNGLPMAAVVRLATEAGAERTVTVRSVPP